MPVSSLFCSNLTLDKDSPNHSFFFCKKSFFYKKIIIFAEIFHLTFGLMKFTLYVWT